MADWGVYNVTVFRYHYVLLDIVTLSSQCDDDLTLSVRAIDNMNHVIDAFNLTAGSGVM